MKPNDFCLASKNISIQYHAHIIRLTVFMTRENGRGILWLSILEFCVKYFASTYVWVGGSWSGNHLFPNFCGSYLYPIYWGYLKLTPTSGSGAWQSFICWIWIIHKCLQIVEISSYWIYLVPHRDDTRSNLRGLTMEIRIINLDLDVFLGLTF